VVNILHIDKSMSVHENKSGIMKKILKIYRENHPILEEPKTIKLKNINEYDKIYRDCYVEFEAGGKVGDDEWRFQFMHNSNVLQELADANRTPIFSGEHYIVLDDWNNISNIKIYLDKKLLVKHNVLFLHLHQKLNIKITPFSAPEYKYPNTPENVFFLPDKIDFSDPSVRITKENKHAKTEEEINIFVKKYE
jgi:hypothetical protein